MLLQFNFKNFRSFRDDTTLDLSATKISECPEHVVSAANEKILPAAAIYGANAHGKSNVLDALRYMHDFVADSFLFGGDTDNKKTKDMFLRPTPFLFDENSKDEESLFEVYFTEPEEAGAKTYNYGFTVSNDGVNEEWLNYRSKSSRGDFRRIFYRCSEEGILDLSGLPAEARSNIEVSLQKETLVVSLGAKLKVNKLKNIWDWFLNNEFADSGRPVENFVLSAVIPQNFDKDKKVRDNVIKYLSVFDPSIVDFEVKTDANRESAEIYAVHRMADSEKTTRIPFQNESSGTLKMFALYQKLWDVLKNGSVLIADELNASLHPLLVRDFLTIFLNPDINKNHAQLIFTTHDSWQLNGNALRRDEIWFAEKDADGISTLYSLADFVDDEGAKIRKDENYEKNYLLGKYGAVPALRLFDMFRTE